MSHAGELDLNDTGEFTVEAWVRRLESDTLSIETVVSNGITDSYWVGVWDGRLQLAIDQDYSQRGNAVIPPDVWTHVAVTWEEGGARQYFINGNLDYTGPAGAAPGEENGSLTIGNDSTAVIDLPFDGALSDIRLWSRVRSQDEIRQSMHVVIEGPLPGLLANWRLDGWGDDEFGFFDANPVGTPRWDGPPSPPQFARAAVDEHFHQLSQTRTGAAVVAIGRDGQALMVGGVRGTAVTSRIEMVDTATGEVAWLNSLPQAVNHAAATYAPYQDAVFVFGGTDLAEGAFHDSIFEINAVTGVGTRLSAALPAPVSHAAAVYHPGVDKIFVLGGQGPGLQDTVRIFDPASRAFIPSTRRLPLAMADMAAAYSAESGDIYLFGGTDASGPTNRIYRLSVDASDPTGQTFSIGTIRFLPHRAAGLSATQDPVSKLIYIVGGYSPYSSDRFDHLVAFDPITLNVWETLLPVQRSDAGLVYDLRNRHALVIGGSLAVDGSGLVSQDDILRIPLGDGPAVPLGHWDYPAPLSTGAGAVSVSAIDGDDNRVLVGTSGDGAWRYDSGGSRFHYDRVTLGSLSGIVNAVRYDAPRNAVLIGTDDNGLYVDDGRFQSHHLAGTRVLSLDVAPDGHRLAGIPFVGGDDGLHHTDFSLPLFTGFWGHVLVGERIDAMAHRGPGDLWVVAQSRLKNVLYDHNGHVFAIIDHGDRFQGASPDDLAIAPNGDFWATVRAAEFGAGIYRLQADQDGQPLGQAQRIEPDATVMGNLASGVSVDAEGRIWVSLYGNETSSGGLAAFEVDDELRGNTPVNWLNGPIGEARSGRTTFGTARFWASNLPDVAGVDERVWTGRGDGTLITYAQRWSQLDQGSGLGDKVVREVWTARGRLFAATDTELLVLQPDGHTWESRAERVQDVFADSRGNIWVGTEDGPLLYQLSGWDTLTSRMGPRPSHRVSDFAEDRDGRIWLGGTDGLTLFDRDRFVTTFTAVNSPLPVTPVRALAVDRDNRLWIGTNQGLAVFQNDVEWTVITQAEGLPSNVIRDLVQLADGRMAVSTNGGLVYLGADFSMTFDTSVPLTTNLWRLAVDEFGQLWVDNALRTADGWRVFHDTNSGLRSTEISGVAADQADRIWFGHAPEAGLSVRGSYLPPLGNVFPQFDAVNAITPTVGSNGTIVEIRGSGFGEDPAELAVTIGGTDVEILTVTNQRIRVRIGPDTTSGDVSVSRAGRRVTSADSFRVRPVVTSFTPTGGNDGVRVTITGTNFDRTAQVRLGDGTFRPAFWISPTQLETTILPTDSSGSVSVRNFAPWNAVLPPLSAAGGGEFHRIELELQEVTFNQGILSTGLVAHRETFVQHFLRHSVAPRPEDRLEIDSAVFQFRGSDPIVVNVCPPSTVDCTVPFETRGGDLTNVDRADVLNSFNVTMVPPGDGSWTGVSDYTVRLMRRGFAIDEWSSSIHVRPNMPLRVLLVPIMRNGSTSEDIERVRRETEQGLDELRRRIMPTGDVELYWSPLTFEVKDVLTRITGDARSIDLGNVLELYDASHELDEARSWWNEHRNPEVLVSFGVVDSRVVEADSASGQAFWPDVSAMLNSAGLDVIDTLCDAVDTVVNVLSFGLAGGDGCELDIPLYVGWARHDGNIEVPGQQSDLFGHELGHIMGLVKPWAYNGTHAFPIPFVTDNFSHSVTDELLEGSCDDDDVRFRRDRTLYYQPGVEEPVVNPLSSRQLYRLLGTGENETERGKAIMSYACGGRNYNAFFEPVDLIDIYTNFAVASAGGFVHNLMSGLPLASAGEAEPVASLSAALATPAAAAAASPDATSTRLYLTGVVNRTTGTGLIERMAPREDSSRVSLSVESGYWLVQLDSSG
ncbi:MAG: LamG-like jellyroll fold domain-containing protein, partial [Pirellulaceae bacterium]